MHIYNYLDQGIVLLLNCCLVLETNFDKKNTTYIKYKNGSHDIFLSVEFDFIEQVIRQLTIIFNGLLHQVHTL